MPKAGGSRSTTGDPGNNGSTSTGGVEIGQDYENKINEAIIVLARSSDNGFIAASTVTTNDLHAISADKSAYKALSKFSKTQLSAYYNDKDFSNKANIFVFANPNQGVKDAILARMTAQRFQLREWEAPIGLMPFRRLMTRILFGLLIIS